MGNFYAHKERSQILKFSLTHPIPNSSFTSIEIGLVLNADTEVATLGNSLRDPVSLFGGGYSY